MLQMSVFGLIETVIHHTAKQKHSVKSSTVLCAKKIVNSLQFLTIRVIFHKAIPEVKVSLLS